MSAQSGIKIPSEVTDTWSEIVLRKQEETRAVVLTIEGEQYKHLTTLAPKSTFKDDISLLLPSLPNEKTCASFIYRTDTQNSSGTYEWILITFVPDDAGVRSKMLHASSKATLLKALGEGRFQKTIFFTSPHDLTPSGFSAHLRHMDAPPPLSKSEQALAQIKADEASEASSRLAAIFGHQGSSPSRGNSGDSLGSAGLSKSPELGIRNAVGIGAMLKPGSTVGGGLKWSEEAETKLKELAHGDEVGRAVMLHIDPKTETLTLQDSIQVPPSQLASKLPTKEPCFTFYAWPADKTPNLVSGTSFSKPSPNNPSRSASLNVPGKEDPASIPLPVTPVGETEPSADVKETKTEEETEGDKTESTTEDEKPTSSPLHASKVKSEIVFIYSCPSASPIRYRMVYSVAVRATITAGSDKIGQNVNKKIEVSEVQDLTESFLKSEIFPSKATTSSWQSHQPIKNPSRQNSAQSAPSPGYRPMPMPNRQSTAPSSTSNTSELSVSDPPSKSSNGSLPDSAFSVFGPRINMGSPGVGGGSFSRPRPAGKR